MMISKAPLKRTASGPLQGIRVLDVTQFVLGPVATQILGDLGADVIKVESPRGDLNRYIGPSRHPGMAAMFMGMNRSKRSVVLDLKVPEALAALYRMVEQVDVFVHSVRADAADRLGIAYDDIRQRNARIVYASAPGYRSDGPWRDRPAFDDVMQGESGLVDLNRLATGEARYMPTVMTDKFCGYVLASSIGMALFHRAQTGHGQSVEVPMLETMLSFNLIEHLWEGAFDEPMGNLGYPRALMAERRPFETRDGEICLLVTSDLQWSRLLSLVGLPDLMKDVRFSTLEARSLHFPELYAEIAVPLRNRDTADWQALFDANEIPNAKARRLSDMPTDPYLTETRFFHHYRHPTAGPFITPGFPVRFSATPAAIQVPPPCLGEHSEEVLTEFGFDTEEINSLLSQAGKQQRRSSG